MLLAKFTRDCWLNAPDNALNAGAVWMDAVGKHELRLRDSIRPDIRSALMTGYADDSLSTVDRKTITVFRKPLDMDALLGFLAS